MRSKLWISVAATLLLAAGTASADDKPDWYWSGQPATNPDGTISIYGISPSGHTVQGETREMYTPGYGYYGGASIPYWGRGFWYDEGSGHYNAGPGYSWSHGSEGGHGTGGGPGF